ncbi:NUDIX hydrolase [Actinokineospora sp. 24-640]
MARRDYLNDPSAPSPNNIAVACSAYVENPNGDVLLIRRSDNGYFSIPGGQLDPGETLSNCAIRETREETGIEIAVRGLIGIYSNPNHVIAYDDGEVRQEFSICFAGTPEGGTLKTSRESLEVRWAPKSSLSQLAIHPSIMLRIRDAQNATSWPTFS